MRGGGGQGSYWAVAPFKEMGYRNQNTLLFRTTAGINKVTS